MDKRLALAERGIEARIAERDAALDAGRATSRWMVVNSNDSAATGCVSPASASASNPSTSILMKDGMPWLRDQRVERRHRHHACDRVQRWRLPARRIAAPR